MGSVVLEPSSMNATRWVINAVSSSDLYELLRRKEKFSEYVDWTYEEHFEDVISELLELQREIYVKWDIKWELMDAIYTFAQLLQKMEKDWLLDVDFRSQKRKIFWRSPNLKRCEKVSRKVENEVWKTLKLQQSQKCG